MIINHLVLSFLEIQRRLMQTKYCTLQVLLLCLKTQAVVHRCSVKKEFLEISQKSQENTCARISFLIKLQPWDLQLY